LHFCNDFGSPHILPKSKTTAINLILSTGYISWRLVLSFGTIDAHEDYKCPSRGKKEPCFRNRIKAGLNARLEFVKRSRGPAPMLYVNQFLAMNKKSVAPVPFALQN
jgi:hypothetical protein